MSKSPYSAANELSRYGRYGDDQLVHMSTGEVQVLDGIAAAFGRNLPRNPHTGLKEAFDLFDILPLALNFIPGIGTAASIALGAGLGAAKNAYRGEDMLSGALGGALGSAIGGAAKGAFGAATDAAAGAATDAATGAATDAATQAATDAATQTTLDAATKGIAAAPGITGELAGDMTGSLLANADKAAMLSNVPTSQIIPGAADAMSTGFDYVKAAAAAPPSAPAPGFLEDIFGAGSDAAVDKVLQNRWALPGLFMAATALPSLGSMGGYDDSGQPMEEGPYTPGDWSRPARQVNPNYGYSPLGEQAAFSSGVNYGFADGGAVDVRDLFNRETSDQAGRRRNEAMRAGDMKEAADLKMLQALRRMRERESEYRAGHPTGASPLDIAYNLFPAMDDVKEAAAEKARRRDIDYGSKYAYGGPVRGIRGYKGGGSVTPNQTPAGNEGRSFADWWKKTTGQTPVGTASPGFGTYQQSPPTQPMGQAAPISSNMMAPQMLGSPQQVGTIGSQGILANMPGQAGGQGGQLGQAYNSFMQDRGAARNNLSYLSGILGNIPAPQPLGGGQPHRMDQNQFNQFLQNRDAQQQDMLRKRMDQMQVNPGYQFNPPSSGSPGMGGSALGPRRDMEQQAFARGGMVGYANGGMVDRAMEPDDRDVIKEAIAAIMGQSPNPDAAIAMFVDRFGEEALQMLMQKVSARGQQGRYIEGAGDGLSDSIPAMVDGQQPSALSTGEFVIPADAVSHLGNGDNKTGAKELYGMIDRLRQARTGSPTPPPAINQRGIMPA